MDTENNWEHWTSFSKLIICVAEELFFLYCCVCCCIVCVELKRKKNLQFTKSETCKILRQWGHCAFRSVIHFYFFFFSFVWGKQKKKKKKKQKKKQNDFFTCELFVLDKKTKNIFFKKKPLCSLDNIYFFFLFFFKLCKCVLENRFVFEIWGGGWFFFSLIFLGLNFGLIFIAWIGSENFWYCFFF